MTLQTVVLLVLGVVAGMATLVVIRGALTMGHCVNCDVAARGCVCVYCLRAALVPLVLAELVHLAASWLTR